MASAVLELTFQAGPSLLDAAAGYRFCRDGEESLSGPVIKP